METLLKIGVVVFSFVLLAAVFSTLGWLFSVAYNYVALDWAGLDWPRMHWGVGVAVVFLLGFLRGGNGGGK